jgi:hypothetical protein
MLGEGKEVPHEAGTFLEENNSHQPKEVRKLVRLSGSVSKNQFSENCRRSDPLLQVAGMYECV